MSVQPTTVTPRPGSGLRHSMSASPMASPVVDMSDVDRRIDRLREVLPPTGYLLRVKKSESIVRLTPDQEREWTKGTTFERGEEQYMTFIPWRDDQGILETVPIPPEPEKGSGSGHDGGQPMTRSDSSASVASSVGKPPKKKISFGAYQSRKRAEAEAAAAAAASGGGKVEAGVSVSVTNGGGSGGAVKDVEEGKGGMSNGTSQENPDPTTSTVPSQGSSNGVKRPSTSSSEDAPIAKRQRTVSPRPQPASASASQLTEETRTSQRRQSPLPSRRNVSTSRAEHPPPPPPPPASTEVGRLATTTKRSRSPSLQKEGDAAPPAKRRRSSPSPPPPPPSKETPLRSRGTTTTSPSKTRPRQPPPVSKPAAARVAAPLPFLLPAQLSPHLPQSIETRLCSGTKPAQSSTHPPPRTIATKEAVEASSQPQQQRKQQLHQQRPSSDLDLAKAWRSEYSRLIEIGRTVKHEGQRLMESAHVMSQSTTDEMDHETRLARAALLGVESLCYFILAFHADTQSHLVQRTPPNQKSWSSILPFWGMVESRCRRFPHLHGLCLQLGAICREHMLESCTDVKEMKDLVKTIRELWRGGYRELSVEDLQQEEFATTWRRRATAPYHGGAGVGAAAGTITTSGAGAAINGDGNGGDEKESKGRGHGMNKGTTTTTTTTTNSGITIIYRTESRDEEGHGKEKGEFYLPLSGITTALEAVRAGLSICSDWAIMKKLKWNCKVDL